MWFIFSPELFQQSIMYILNSVDKCFLNNCFKVFKKIEEFSTGHFDDVSIPYQRDDYCERRLRKLGGLYLFLYILHFCFSAEQLI